LRMDYVGFGNYVGYGTQNRKIKKRGAERAFVTTEPDFVS